jgi:hypothetical protein
MLMPTTRLAPFGAAVVLLLGLGLAGCAQPQPVTTDDPVVTAPSESAAPEPKPTSAMDHDFCYDDMLMDPATQEHHGGDVPWPAPLTDDAFPIEPSCWSDEIGDGAYFSADWRVLGPTDRDALLVSIQDALAAAGLSVAFTSGDGNTYHIDSYETGDVMLELRYDDHFTNISLNTAPPPQN